MELITRRLISETALTDLVFGVDGGNDREVVLKADVYKRQAVGQIRESLTFREAVQMAAACCQEIFEHQNKLSVEIYEAVQYIEKHLSEKLTLNQVAFHIGLSPNYLSSLFKKELHISFVDYITESRVKKAKDLLLETDLKTHEVAEITGFADDSYFSKTFKKITGKLPSSFRKRTKL